jgi:CNT family concentrative nucleoside transporter
MPDAQIIASTVAERLQSAFGLVVFCLMAWWVGRLLGARGVPWRVILWGITLQFAFAAIVLFSPGLLEQVQNAVQKLLDFTLEGCRMVFGDSLVEGSARITDADGKPGGVAVLGFNFAVRVLPTIIFVSMLTAILYHIGVLGLVVRGLAWVMHKTMGTSGAETLSTAANIFVGQTEAPLVVKPFLAMATRSELMAIMVGGFANIASGVIVAYTQFLRDFVPNAGGHLAAACLVSAPATLLVSKLLVPETQTPETAGSVGFRIERADANLIDAATRGTSEGVALAINVGAMLIAFTALVAMLNALFGWVGGWFGFPSLTMESVLGWMGAPLMWLTGCPWEDCHKAGALLGVKTVLNEFVAYLQMSQALTADRNYLTPRSALLTTYALCGFANFASVGIQIGGISTLAPSRRADLSRLGLLAMFGGAIASLMGACVVGVLV